MMKALGRVFSNILGRYSGILQAGKICAVAVIFPVPAFAQSGPPPQDQAAPAVMPFEFVTLGTQGGPMPSVSRSQPANLIVRRGEAYLVDVGDGAAGQMIASGAMFPWLRGIFISHIHMDHIGGLYAILGLRQQMNIATPLTIYGPPQTKAIVDGLLAALAPSAESGYGVPGEVTVPASTNVTVVELRDGDTVVVNDMTVRAAANTHYSFADGSEMANKYEALSLRFDLSDRSIVYTGDTGVSAAVEELAQGADLLLSEMIDLPHTFQMMSAMGQQLTDQVRQNMQHHLGDHHLSPQQVGELAQRAGVASVVVTHLAGGGDPNGNLRYVREIQEIFNGPVVIAEDLERF